MNRLRADGLLLLVALVWGSSFVVQRVAARYFDPFTFNGLRFLLGGLILLPYSKMNLLKRPNSISAAKLPNTNHGNALTGRVRKSALFMLLAGGLLFGSAGFQQLGLESTTAGNAGFISSLYVVFVPVLLMVFWREHLHWLSLTGVGIAILGSLLLSTGGSLHLGKGDAFEMVGALFGAVHVLLVSRAVRTVDVLTFSSGQFLAAGVLNLVVSMVLRQSYGGLVGGWWTIVYIGLISTAVGYTLQGYGQRIAPPTDATILLSMESVFAAMTGFVFLGEKLVFVQLVGCSLIIVAVIVTQMRSVRLRGLSI